MEVVLAFCFKNFEIFSNIKQVECVFENVGTEFSSLEILQEPEARDRSAEMAGVGRQRNKKVREAGERGTGSGRLSPPCPPPPTEIVRFEIPWYFLTVNINRHFCDAGFYLGYLRGRQFWSKTLSFFIACFSGVIDIDVLNRKEHF